MSNEMINTRRDAGEAAPQRWPAARWSYAPEVDVLEDVEEFTVLADLPGVRASEVEINYEDGRLLIHGRPEERQPAKTEYLVHEYGAGEYHRAFRVGEGIDTTRISAELSSGVLTVHLPKAESAKPRRIPVRPA